jgi:hypothetical protein
MTTVQRRAARTNATFFRAATKQRNSVDQRPWAWHWLPGWKRLLIKLSAGLGPWPTLWWWFSYPELHALAIVLGSVVTAFLSQLKFMRWIGRRNHVNNVVRPLHEALGRIIGDVAPLHWQDWIHVPRDYDCESTAGVRIHLPAALSWPPGAKTLFVDAVSQKLGIAELDVQWHLAGEHPCVIFKPIAQAPTKVGYADVRDAIATTTDTRPIVGVTKHDRVVALDLEDDSPHILISAGSGGGKSVLAKVLIAQFLSRGARVIIMDRKRISHRWAKDLPGIEYYRDTEEIHDKLISLAQIGDIRNKQTDDGDRTYQRIVLVFEEMNATMNKLTGYWTSIRESSDPRRSPALEALGDLVNMGRQVSMHVVAIGQRVETRTLGGGDIRESFGIRCLSRYTVQTWKMLCADVWPMPKKSPVRGRWQIVVAAEATETQVACLSDTEAQGLALSVVPAAVPTGMSSCIEGVGTAADTSLVDLKTFFGDEYDRKRKRLLRDPQRPMRAAGGEGSADLYRRDDLDAWERRWDAAHV